MANNNLPTTPDPFWPAGAQPEHLSVEDARNNEIVDRFVDLTTAWKCEKCGTTVGQSNKDPRYCNDCYVLETKNSLAAKQINADWMQQSTECGLQIFERQPEENNLEWLVWTKYREHYPLKLPTWTELAKECNTSVATVTKVAQKWSFRVRIQSWARYTDGSMQQTRIEAIKDMNERQLDMAQKLQQKLQVAIDVLNPALLKPNELVSLLKAATDLERRIAVALPEKVENEAIESSKKNGMPTKVEDLGDVVAILQSTGAFDGKIIGIEQTTRLVAKEATDA